MERESFEDEKIAALMNDLFINIKVDREERPDLDEIYMNAVQMLTGRGGWPMTVFLTPRQALLRRHLFSTGGPLRRSGVPKNLAGRRQRLSAKAPRCREKRRTDSLGAAADVSIHGKSAAIFV